MSAYLCIHGHFYQPPRENPYLGEILPEGSAAPMANWNERIARESYGPLGFARRLDGQGRIFDILNAYAWISFNVGPTLTRWLKRTEPDILKRMQEGDAQSVKRLGYGNAMAQAYHHSILPLASARDKRREIRWALADFKQIFQRRAEGMWLPECAVDTATLEMLIDEGVRFIILAPAQAKAVLLNGEATEVNEHSLDTSQAYTISLSAGQSITCVFYNGSLSQRIAFEGLLRNGEQFWQNICAAKPMEQEQKKQHLITLATDGETYGHHFPFGEMGLAFVLAQALAGRDEIQLTNISAFVAANPPTQQAILHSPSSWSCVHGVERWQSNCGCSTGGHPGWNQQWRAPLRRALNYMKEQIDAHYDAAAALVMHSPEEALLDYGTILAAPDRKDDYAKRWFLNKTAAHPVCWNLLAMQEQALAAFASCAWFFDDISRIEPRNAMAHALRAFDLLSATGGSPDFKQFEHILDEALSNDPEQGTGENIFLHKVKPEAGGPASITLFSCFRLACENKFPALGQSATCDFPNLSVEISLDAFDEAQKELSGSALLKDFLSAQVSRVRWRWSPFPADHISPLVDIALKESCFRVTLGNKRSIQEIDLAALADSMKNSLLTSLMKSTEACTDIFYRTAARQIIQLWPLWEEGQKTVQGLLYWHAVIPYLVQETVRQMLDQPAFLKQLKSLVETQTTAASSALTTDLAERYLLDQLKTLPWDEQKLCSQIQLLRYLHKDMDFWRIQNFIWQNGVRDYPLFANCLGFR